MARVRLFHYHLATARERDVEAAYLARGFEFVARFGRIGPERRSFEASHSWEELDALGFRLRLTQLDRDGVEVVVQPGKWSPPRVDHVGVFVSIEEHAAALQRAADLGLAIQERGGRRTFVGTGAGLRVELRHDPGGSVASLELRLVASDPGELSSALATVLGLSATGERLTLDKSTIRFLPGGPAGRPQFAADGLPGSP